MSLDSVTITMPWPSPKLHAHNKGHWRSKVKATSSSREEARMLALAEMGPDWNGPFSAALLLIYLEPPSRHKRDIPNVTHALKPAVDGMVDAGVVIDDNMDVIHGMMVWRGPVTPPGCVKITIQGTR